MLAKSTVSCDLCESRASKKLHCIALRHILLIDANFYQELGINYMTKSLGSIFALIRPRLASQ